VSASITSLNQSMLEHAMRHALLTTADSPRRQPPPGYSPTRVDALILQLVGYTWKSKSGTSSCGVIQLRKGLFQMATGLSTLGMTLVAAHKWKSASRKTRLAKSKCCPRKGVSLGERHCPRYQESHGTICLFLISSIAASIFACTPIPKTSYVIQPVSITDEGV